MQIIFITTNKTKLETINYRMENLKNNECKNFAIQQNMNKKRASIQTTVCDSSLQ